MSKTHLPQNKETIVMIGVITLIVAMGFFNALILIPKLIGLYSVEAPTTTTLPIDTETVNRAIELLE